MASIKQFIERRDNIASIVAYLRRVGKATRIEISSVLSLSWACVSDLVALLINREVIVESSEREKNTSSVSKGRTPTYLSLNEKKYFLGIDINDSGMAITVLSINGNLLNFKKWDAEVFTDESELSKSICEKIREMLGVYEDCCGIGVAMEGMKTECGWMYPIKDRSVAFLPDKIIRNSFDLPVYVRHDPECMLYALADSLDEDCMTLRVDNGIDVAAMKDGKILSLPLELGHIICGGEKLKNILKASKLNKNYSCFARELGFAAANLAMLLGVKKVFIVGEIIEWFDEIASVFESSFKSVNKKTEYDVSGIKDASEGAARVAMAEYPNVEDM